MAKTIIQTIGPLYGDVVNGTVFGRPNGSIYVPSSNTILAELADAIKFVRIVTYDYGDRLQFCTSSGAVSLYSYRVHMVAESQDIQSSIGISLEDEDGNAISEVRYSTAGIFNTNQPYAGGDLLEGETVENGADYLLNVSLYSSSGVPVATYKIPIVGFAE